jgi:hypothetical protein
VKQLKIPQNEGPGSRAALMKQLLPLKKKGCKEITQNGVCTHTVTQWCIHINNVAMEMQQCVLFSIAELQKILYCLYLQGCLNILITLAWTDLIIYRFYVTVNNINILNYWTVFTYKDSVHTSHRTPCE